MEEEPIAAEVIQENQTEEEQSETEQSESKGTEEADPGTQTVINATDMGSISITIPEGWEYRMHLPNEDGEMEWFGTEFWPEEEPEACVTVKYCDEWIGICATGVTAEKMEFSMA